MKAFNQFHVEKVFVYCQQQLALSGWSGRIIVLVSFLCLQSVSFDYYWPLYPFRRRVIYRAYYIDIL